MTDHDIQLLIEQMIALNENLSDQIRAIDDLVEQQTQLYNHVVKGHQQGRRSDDLDIPDEL